MPAYSMQQQGVDHSVIDKAIYTGGHDATALAVANGKVDAGAMDELVYGRMIKEGKLSESQVRVFYTTPPFFDYVWAAPQRAQSCHRPKRLQMPCLLSIQETLSRRRYWTY